MDLRQRLQLIVEATTGKADAEFRKLTGTTRELGTSAERSAQQVRTAADRVADARERERVAAGQLQVAERRLQELRESGRARASQLLAAEEKAAAAQRTLQRAVRGTETALREQQEAQQAAARGMADVADENERSAGLLAGASERARGALVGIGAAGVGAGLRSVAEGFTSGARAAGLFATSTNSTVEQAGAFLGLVGAMGLELNDLLEIQAEFATKAAASGGELANLGAELARNSDGTVNWTESLVTFLDQLQGVEDATERNRLGFQFLGEEGYKQLSTLVASGTDVRDALERIGVPFTPEDVRAAADFDAAMLDLSLSGQQAAGSLGRLLVPAATAALEGFGDVVGVLEDVGPVLVASTAAAIALGVTGFSPTAAAGARLAAVTAVVNRNLLLFRSAALQGGAAAGTLGAGMGVAAVGARGLLSIVGGPLGAAVIGLAAVYTLASDGAEDFRQSAKDVAVELEQQPAASAAAGRSVRELARDLAEQAGAWERAAAAARGAQEVDLGWDPIGATNLAGLLGDTELAAVGYEAQIKDAQEALGTFGGQQELASTTTRKLSDLIAEGTTTGDEFARSVQNAAEAQAAEAHSSGLAEAAIAAYNAVTRDAVESTLALWDANLRQRDGLRSVQGAIKDAAEATQDSATPWDDVQESIDGVIGAALEYASTSSDAAVAGARAAGDVVDAQAEAAIRGQETIRALYETLQQPGITDSARDQVAKLIGDLREAQESGDVEAILRLTGAAETAGEIDETTKDRDARVRVESRNGPAVKAYLDGLADAKRLSLIRVESRNGPAVREYLDGLAGQERLSIIRVESRNGPAVDDYLDRLAGQTRTAYIDVRERGGTGTGGGSTGPGSPMLRGAPAIGGDYGSGSVTIQHQTVQLVADSSGRVSQQNLAAAGRDVVAQIRAYERRNGSSWRRGGNR